MQELKDLLSGVPGGDNVPESMLNNVLQMSLIPDDEGNLPGAAAYTPKHDVYYAALSLVGWLKAQPQVTSAGSEGTSVTTTAFDWDSLGEYFRSMSLIASQSSVFTVLTIPEYRKVRHTNMRVGGNLNDRDTDIN